MTSRFDSPRSSAHDTRVCARAGLISLVVSVVLLAAKFEAYRRTGSTAVLSDALESIVNVAAALFAIGSIAFAGRPADRNHPYGHGKVEFFAAAFEGGLIAFAAILVVYQALQALITGVELRALEQGLVIVAGAGIANALLGGYLVHTGRKYHSLTLVADGKHVFSDSVTSAGILLGLLCVRLTGLTWLDPEDNLLVELGAIPTERLWTRTIGHAPLPPGITLALQSVFFGAYGFELSTPSLLTTP